MSYNITGLIIVGILLAVSMIRRWCKNAVTYPDDYDDNEFTKIEK